MRVLAILFVSLLAVVTPAIARMPWGTSSANDQILPPPTLAPLVRRVAPAVVSIAIKGRVAMEQNPLFNDPSNHDFHLTAGSPSIDAADGDVAPTLDMDGNARVDDTNVGDTGTGNPPYADHGAFEYQP